MLLARRLTMFRCLPSWARWRSLAALYYSWQAERNRFGGHLLLALPFFTYWKWDLHKLVMQLRDFSLVGFSI